LILLAALAVGCDSGSASREDDGGSTKQATEKLDAGDASGTLSVSHPEDSLGQTEADAAGLFGGTPVVTVAAETDAATNAARDAGPPPLLSCKPRGGNDAQKLIDDFEDEDNLIIAYPASTGEWYASKDDSNGTFALTFEALAEPRGVSLAALHAVGAHNTTWGAAPGIDWLGCVFDASRYVGVHFWARGVGQIRLASAVPAVVPQSFGGSCTREAAGGCWDSHQTTVALSADWQEHFIPFDTLKQMGWGVDAGPFDPSQMFNLEFQTQMGTAFDFWVDDLSLYDAADLTSQPDAGGSIGDAADASASDADAALLDAGARATDSSPAPSAQDASPSDGVSRDAATGETSMADAASDSGL
jgi:hypothetical protein